MELQHGLWSFSIGYGASTLLRKKHRGPPVLPRISIEVYGSFNMGLYGSPVLAERLAVVEAYGASTLAMEPAVSRRF